MRLFLGAFFITLVGMPFLTWAIPHAQETGEVSHFQDITANEKEDLEFGSRDPAPWRFLIEWTTGNILKRDTLENDFVVGGGYILPGLKSHPWAFEFGINPSLKWAVLRIERFQYWQQFRGQDVFWGIYGMQGIDASNQLGFVTELTRLKLGIRLRMDQMFAGIAVGSNGYEFHMGLEIPIKF